MLRFGIKHEIFAQWCLINQYWQPVFRAVVFGIRGSLPENVDATTLGTEQRMRVVPVDYEHCRCTLGIWVPRSKTLIALPGSTSPHQRYIDRHLAGRSLSNEMVPGYYRAYRKGSHAPINRGNTHRALRQDYYITYRRTNDDDRFEQDDYLAVGRPQDNIHAAYSSSHDRPFYSAGCQVIVGFPKSRNNPTGPSGPWKTFDHLVYETFHRQIFFDYLLMEGTDIVWMLQHAGQRIPIRLRFGSQGPQVRFLQRALKAQGDYLGNLDGDFGPLTWTALRDIQLAHHLTDDGILGPQTASVLGMTLPRVQVTSSLRAPLVVA